MFFYMKIWLKFRLDAWGWVGNDNLIDRSMKIDIRHIDRSHLNTILDHWTLIIRLCVQMQDLIFIDSSKMSVGKTQTFGTLSVWFAIKQLEIPINLSTSKHWITFYYHIRIPRFVAIMKIRSLFKDIRIFFDSKKKLFFPQINYKLEYSTKYCNKNHKSLKNFATMRIRRTSNSWVTPESTYRGFSRDHTAKQPWR